MVGAGSWGTAFACLLRDNGHDVTLAARDPAQAAAISETARNPRYAREASLEGIAATPIADAPVAGAELVVVAVPSRVFGDVVRSLPGDAPLLSLTKGLDPATGARLSTLVEGRPVAVLSGPNIADEIVRGLPAAAVVASDDLELAVRVQVAVHSVLFRVYVSDDVAGVELCAAAKNVIALAAGGADGLSLGRQLQGGARRAWSGGDAPARRVGRCTSRHVRGPRGYGRPHRDVLVAVGKESAGG